jgi:hypothetical protein
MALYRFLFAPVLLAVAVLIGSRDRAGAPPSHTPVAADTRAAAAGAAPVVPTSQRAARAHTASVR